MELAVSTSKRKGKKPKRLISILLAATILAATACTAGCSAGLQGRDNALLGEFKQHALYKDGTLTLEGYTPCKGGAGALGFEIPYLYYSLTQETGEITDWDQVEANASEGSSAEAQQQTGSLLILIYRDAMKASCEYVDMWLINLESRQYVLMKQALKSPVPPAGGSTRLDKADVIKKVEALVRLASKNKAK